MVRIIMLLSLLFNLNSYATLSGTAVTSQDKILKSIVYIGVVLANPTDADDDFWTCTGTVISEHFILTAAHCMPENANDKLVILSHESSVKEAHFLANAINSPKPIFKNHIRWSLDKEAMKKGRTHDLSLVYSPIDLTKTGSVPVNLFNGTKVSYLNKYHSVIAYGYGDGLNSLKTGVQLKKETININTMSYQTPKDYFPFELFTESTPETGLTTGDSGGPSFSVNSKQIVQIAVNSHVINHTTTSSIWISNYKAWLEETMKELGGVDDELKWTDRI